MKNSGSEALQAPPVHRVQSPAESAVSTSGVGVRYRAYRNRPGSLKESFLRLVTGKGPAQYEYLDALSEVTIDIPRGCVFALIGGNGSGKSTLLKVIAKVLIPTSGTVSVSGSVASLIELGAGFDPEQTAVENIYLHGALHRRSAAEIAPTVKKILEFAELTEFAHSPVKYYSSGMYARLGFSVAVNIDPDIFLVDEILGVGDERFQKKCAAIFEQFIARGKTIILVSHDTNLIETIATHAALLSKGQVVFVGKPDEAISRYRTGTYQQRLS